MTFGEKLSKLRKENNCTQEQLADILSVSRQAISKWESNITYPETDKLIRMSELSEQDAVAVKQALDTVVPRYLAWVREIIKLFL